MTLALEIAANAINAISILLAGRGNVHTWWTGMLGCAAFGVLFYRSQLYADALLQIFFIGSSIVGWQRWRAAPDADGASVKPIRRTPISAILAMSAAALAVAATHAWLLAHFTDAYAPVPDALVLVLSVLGQLLLVDRRLETWWCWLAVNAIAVPLYASRGLMLTALLYAGFLVNAWVSLRRWRAAAAPWAATTER